MMRVLTGLVCLLIAGRVLAYPDNYASLKMGASVICEAKLDVKQDPNALLSDAPIPTGQLVFSNVAQEQIFTIDLGDERIFDRVELTTGSPGEESSVKRIRIDTSLATFEGPYTTVFETRSLGLHQVLRLPKVKARWVRFDFGPGPDGLFAGDLRIYKSYEHPRLAEAVRLLHERIAPDLPGLGAFYRACDNGNWTSACAALRAYCLEKCPADPPDPGYELARAEAFRSGKLEFAGIGRIAPVPVDWSFLRTADWSEHRRLLNQGLPIFAPVKACYYTGDKKWALHAKAIFYDWIDANPKPSIACGAAYPAWGVTDASVRSEQLVSCFSLVTVSREFDDEFWANWLYSIWEHADFLRQDESGQGSHVASSMAAVASIATAFPLFAAQRDWLVTAKSGIEKSVIRDYYQDGKPMDDAAGSIASSLSAALSVFEALDAARLVVDADVRRRVEKASVFLAAITQPDGSLPAIGDWDGALACPLPGAILRRGDLRFVLTKGKEGKMPQRASVDFDLGQWSVMRSAYDATPYEDARHLVFKTSREAHCHNDLLAITNYAYGRELLIDPGARHYQQAEGRLFAHTASHNAVCIDGVDQGDGPGRTDRWFSNAGFDYALGSHHTYKGLVVVRVIVFVKPDYWIVLDEIEADNQIESQHTYDQNWHFAEAAGITEDAATKAVHTSYLSGGNLQIVPIQPESLRSSMTEFQIARRRVGGQVDSVPSKGWRYSVSGITPVVLDAVLYPYIGAQVPNISAARIAVEGSPAGVAAWKVSVGDCTDYIIISRKEPRAISLPSEQIKADAEMVVIRTKGGELVRVSGARVKSITFRGKSLFPKGDLAPDVDVVFP